MRPAALAEDLEVVARARPDVPAVVIGERIGGLRRARPPGRRAAAALRDLGVGRGDRVALVMSNSVEMVVAVYAILRAGAAFSPISPGVTEAKLTRILADVGAAAVVCDGENRGLVSDSAAAGRESRSSTISSARAEDPGEGVRADDRTRPRGGDLHLRLDRRAEGRDADPREHVVRRRFDRREPRNAGLRPRPLRPAALLRLRPLPAADLRSARGDAGARAGLRRRRAGSSRSSRSSGSPASRPCRRSSSC